MAGFTFAQEESKPTEKKETPPPFDSLKDQASYTIGQNLASQIKFNDQLDLNFELVIEGFTDKLGDKDSKMTERQMQEAMLALQQQLRDNASKKEEMAAAENIKAGQEFLAKNAKREEVTTTKSGLQYEVLKDGEGKVSPKPTDKVTTHYHGTLLDGTVFDSSVQRGEPIDFPVNGVIKGWTEALQLMQVGDKYKLYIPADLAYGNRGAGGKIGPGETLIFEVELLAINGEK
ncbi:MAG: FKBP-type peptidyl-prolyl cis-trans isomerase [Planctomycetaceae bacterium]|nr:FKBP-type peptidyl-prolyl cis-trans isomerase [Planctomycetaceae bacterium]